MAERMVLVADKDYFFMIGFNAAMKAYKDEDEYRKTVKMDIAAEGLYETWSQYDPYLFANYLEIELPEDEKERDYVYKGIEAAMDNFLLKCFTQLHEIEEEIK